MKTEVLIKGEVRYLRVTLISGKNDEVDVLSRVDFCLLPIWRSEIFAGNGYWKWLIGRSTRTPNLPGIGSVLLPDPQI